MKPWPGGNWAVAEAFTRSGRLRPTAGGHRWFSVRFDAVAAGGARFWSAALGLPIERADVAAIDNGTLGGVAESMAASARVARGGEVARRKPTRGEWAPPGQADPGSFSGADRGSTARRTLGRPAERAL